MYYLINIEIKNNAIYNEHIGGYGMNIYKRNIILVGKSQSGKTTLTQYLTNQKLSYHKTQAVEIVGGQFIDTPGEYLEQRGSYGALSVTATGADVVAFVQSAVEDGSMFAPGFGSMFCGKPIIGIVTKIDLANEEQLKQAEWYLTNAGAAICFRVSSINGQGMIKLGKWIQEL